MTANSAAECLGVFNIFAGTVNPDPSIRAQAENQLKQVIRNGIIIEMTFSEPLFTLLFLG